MCSDPSIIILCRIFSSVQNWHIGKLFAVILTGHDFYVLKKGRVAFSFKIFSKRPHHFFRIVLISELPWPAEGADLCCFASPASPATLVHPRESDAFRVRFRSCAEAICWMWHLLDVLRLTRSDTRRSVLQELPEGSAALLSTFVPACVCDLLISSCRRRQGQMNLGRICGTSTILVCSSCLRPDNLLHLFF